MRERTISRSDFLRYIEWGIQEGLAHGLTEADANALRHVGRTAKRVARASVYEGACGCPAAQAGLWPLGNTEPTMGVFAFATGFDSISAGATDHANALVIAC